LINIPKVEVKKFGPCLFVCSIFHTLSECAASTRIFNLLDDKPFAEMIEKLNLAERQAVCDRHVHDLQKAPSISEPFHMLRST